MFTVYATSDLIGSPDKMWELLQAASAANPVDGNAQGSYVTMVIFFFTYNRLAAMELITSIAFQRWINLWRH